MTDISASTVQSVSTATEGKPLPPSSARLSLATANKILGLLAVVAAACFVASLAAGVVKLIGVSQHIKGLEAKGAEAAAAAAPAKEFVKPIPIDPALDNRNIFQPAGSPDAGGDVAGATGAGVYRLVGISASKDPAETYVMLENSQSKLTYFLQYNQPVEGLELEKILEDKVVVKIGGKAVEFE